MRFSPKHRRDQNHAEISDAYRELHCDVFDTSQVGNGFPDLGIGLSGRLYGREIKVVGEGLSDEQEAALSVWRGPKVKVIRTVRDVMDDVTDIRRSISRWTITNPSEC